MAKLSDKSALRLAVLAKAADAERQIRADARVKADALVAQWVGEAKMRTDALIAESLRAGDLISHIHTVGLKTKDSSRVYRVKKEMDWTQEATVTDVVMTADEWIEINWSDTHILKFTTSVGEVTLLWPESEDALVALDPEQQSIVDEGHGLFVAAIKKWFDEKESGNEI